MARKSESRRYLWTLCLIEALWLPTCIDARMRAERDQHLQQESGLVHLRTQDAVKATDFIKAGKSTSSSAIVSLFSQPYGAIVSWALPLHRAFVGHAAALVQTVIRNNESDEPLMRIKLTSMSHPEENDLTTAGMVPSPNVYALLFTALLWGSCATGAAYYFRTHPDVVMLKSSEGGPEQLSRFSTDVFDEDAWFNDRWICAWSICCPCVLWADTVDRLGFLGYWIAFAIFAFLWILYHAFAIVICWWALAIFLTYHRHRIRQAFGMHVQWAIATFIGDCLCFCSGCLPCLISQEARHVKRAAALGHSAVACTSDIPTA
eukprot:TRINITY_DN2982_c0_g2_i2.p1 TRINITY_DN2982_c0_g2~~TRINITY_DN2982_c0_g2_i2.p1  ORF type:complete len:319 (+),score=33.68 TRINITY_DN2982_c0_g2_i2:70-1026(+)